MRIVAERTRHAVPGVERESLPRPGRQRSAGRAAVAMMLLVLQLGGCFRYVPVGGDPVPVGARVSLAVNDRGRVGLAESVGPGARVIHGDYVASSDSRIVLSMTSVEFLDLNVPARMDGKRVEVPREFVADFRERRLSRTRTWITVGVVVMGLAAATLIGISGFGTDGDSDRPGNGDGGDNQ